MKKSVIVFVIICTACGSLANKKMLSWEQGCEEIKLENNQLIIPLIVDKKRQLFVLDFSTKSSMFEGQCDDKSARGTELKQTTKPIKNGLFHGSKTFNLEPTKIPSMAEGTIGYSIITQDKFSSLLNFDTNKICQIDEIETKETIAISGFKEIKSRFYGDSFSIFFTIRKIEYEFHFETTSPETFKMPYKETIPFIKEPNRKLETKSGVDLIFTKSIAVNKIYYSTEILVSSFTQRPKCGMGFIKGFNWLIDVPNKKVYLKKNSISLDRNIQFRYDPIVDSKK